MRLAVPLLFAALTACSGVEPTPPGSGLLLIGGGPDDGSAGYVEVQDGSELTLHPGAQGGFHVYINLRFDEGTAARFDPKPLISRVVRREATDQLVSRSKHTSSLVEAPDDAMFDTELSIPVFLCPSPVGIPVADETLRIEVEAAIDEDDPEPVKGQLRFIPRCPTGFQGEFCQRICFG